MAKETLSAEDFEPPGTRCGLGELKPETVIDFTETTTPRTETLFQKAHQIPRFRSSSQALFFRRRFFPDATVADWNDWRWQVRHRIRNMDNLSRIIQLSQDEWTQDTCPAKQLPIAITPYYASLIDRGNPQQPLRRTVVPVSAEYVGSPGEAIDPLGEDHDSPIPGLVHRYPDRVLLLATGFCATYCRYCTRSRLVGNGGKLAFNRTQLENALAYIESHASVRDVLISGGDPLTLSDEKLEWLLARLHRIGHVEFVRIGTKVPVVLPQRITPALTRMLRRYHPLWMSIHCTHPDELTPEVTEACGRLADAGIPLGSQTVLLAGVNDTVETMKHLMHGLLQLRVKPYYLYQCDPILGSAHFRTPVERGIEIIAGLRGHTTGYAVPTYVIDAPGGGGKIPIFPASFVGRDGDDLLLKNYQRRVYRYPDPGGMVAG
jgi:lysine 2,3-aminomutase